MISFVVVYNKSKETVNIVNDSLETLNDSYSKVFLGDRIGVAIRKDSASPDSMKSDYFYYDVKSGCGIVTNSRIDYRKELAEKLDIDLNVNEGITDSKLIIFAYLKWGEAFLKYLYGDFSFVIWGPEEDQLLCARDHFGCRSVYFVDQVDLLVVSSTISAFESLSWFKLELEEHYILDSICSIEMNDDHSAYKGVHRLKPAHYIKYSPNTVSEQYRYWDLEVNKNYLGLSLEEASRELRKRIFESVRQRIDTKVQMGVELSGGLDSSGITSVLVKLLGQNAPILAFTHSISSEAAAQQNYLKSEMEFSVAIAAEFSCIRQIVVTEENSEGAYESLINVLNQMVKPINQSFSMNSDLLYRAASKLGTSVMFSGLGGDEGITNNGMGYFNELIKRGHHSQLRDDFKNIVYRRGGNLYRLIFKHYINHYAPWMHKMVKEDWRNERFRSFALQQSLARKYRMKRRFFSITSFPNNPDVRTIQYFRLMHPNIPKRLEETSLFSQKLGIEYRYPFLDVKLLEFFYSLPSEYKYKDGYGRYLFRQAMEGILPDKIRQRTDKVGTTIPNVLARVLKDEEAFRELIGEGQQNNRYHYVDYSKLNGMLDAFNRVKEVKRLKYAPRTFLSPISVLILQKWQREGRIDIGIKC